MLAFGVAALAVAAFRKPLGKAPTNRERTFFGTVALADLWADDFALDRPYNAVVPNGVPAEGGWINQPRQPVRILALSSIIECCAHSRSAGYRALNRWTIVSAKVY